ncbi:hypothetical protein Pan97_03030 [Bremerella volcania]|uniref:Uncharacterized protein n=1 Tax=Bremerella volcania TaxID=2527984 RepID=A0A518C293_9BACT|nr:hypothetical protein [Bremerella volcania]QDU73333.1 hypothetical protein Pan97_03030 [Bremerella volcania]
MFSPASIRFRTGTVALAILSMVYSYGVCPGGCLEENQWYAALHHLVEHDHEMPSCAHEHDPTEHCNCDLSADTPLLVSSRTVDDDGAPFIAWLPILDLPTSTFTIVVSGNIFQVEHGAGPPTTTLRAQSQLFRC